MSKTKEQILIELHAEAMMTFDEIQSAQRDERLQCLQDRRFYSVAGAMWEDALGHQFENRPKMEVNKIHLSVIRIINEYRNNRIAVNFAPTDGEERGDLSDTCAKLYRADEYDSMAEEAYDNAFEEAVGGGIGAWRLRSEYEDEEDPDDERQRIRIEPIFDADSSVYFDLNAKRQDKSDAECCFVLCGKTRASYEDEFGELPASIGKDVFQTEFDWVTDDIVYIAEYYKVHYKRETVHIFRGIDGMERRVMHEDLDDELITELQAPGFVESRQKKIKVKRIRKYLIDGARVLEDLGYVAGKNIPIVPVYGKRWIIDNIERSMGHVRLAKDAQRLKNMQLTKLAEISAIGSIEKPIMTPDQVAGHQQMWSDDNIRNYPYLLVNALTDASGSPTLVGPQTYTKPPQIPPAMAALLQITEQDIKDILGNQQQGEELKANLSGRAIELVQNKVDMQSYIYMSNMAKAIKRSGEIWLSMAKDIFVEENRKLKGIGENGDTESIKLMQPTINKETGELEYENDLSEADFDVQVTVGPTSTSKRDATVRSLLNMLPLAQDPETQQIISSMVMMNMDGEGIQDARDYFRRRLVRIGAVKPTEEEMQQMAAESQGQQPDANAQFLQASAEEAQANAAKARADTILTVARAEETKAKTGETKAKTLETLSKVEAESQNHLIGMAQKIGAMAMPSGEMPPTAPQNEQRGSAQPFAGFNAG
jgi:hypothetical protein